MWKRRDIFAARLKEFHESFTFDRQATAFSNRSTALCR